MKLAINTEVYKNIQAVCQTEEVCIIFLKQMLFVLTLEVTELWVGREEKQLGKGSVGETWWLKTGRRETPPGTSGSPGRVSWAGAVSISGTVLVVFPCLRSLWKFRFPRKTHKPTCTKLHIYNFREASNLHTSVFLALFILHQGGYHFTT